jgi:hypothetical protein
MQTIYEMAKGVGISYGSYRVMLIEDLAMTVDTEAGI